MRQLKSWLKKKVFGSSVLHDIANKVFLSNKFRVEKGSGNVCDIRCLLHHSNISIKGQNNKVIVEGNSNNKIDITILGDNNSIHIARDVFCRDVTLWMEGDSNRIQIGKDTVFAGRIQLSAIEGTKIEIGEKCLFSDDIDIRSGDGHSILNNKGERTNDSQDVTIGNHVWCGRSVSILKSVEVAPDCVIGTRSVLTKKYLESNVVLAGCPAKVVKQDTSWAYER